MPCGESLQFFCVKNKVPYNIFHKWYKDTRNKIVSVQIDGIPVDEGVPNASSTVDPCKSLGSSDKPVRIWVEFRMSNALHLFQKNLSYRDLVRMVEKLESLC